MQRRSEASDQQLKLLRGDLARDQVEGEFDSNALRTRIGPDGRAFTGLPTTLSAAAPEVSMCTVAYLVSGNEIGYRAHRYAGQRSGSKFTM